MRRAFSVEHPREGAARMAVRAAIRAALRQSGQTSDMAEAPYSLWVAHSSDSTSACSSTVCVAFSCLSGG